MFRHFILLSLVSFVACTPLDIATPDQRARFDTYPSILFRALESVCSEPQDSFVRTSRDEIECRSYLPPAETAALISQFGGTIDDLPQTVIRLRVRRAEKGYLAQYDTHLRVPRSSGPTLEVPLSSPAISRPLSSALKKAGGELL